MAELPVSARLTYAGLWCLADDAGYFVLNVREIGGALYRHESRAMREKRVQDSLDRLAELGRIQLLPCGEHALIPKLPDYRFNAGSLIFTVQKRHESCEPKNLSLGLAISPVSRASDKSPSDSSSESVLDSSSSSSSSSGRHGAKKNGSKDPDEERAERLDRYRAMANNKGLSRAARDAAKQQVELMESGRVH